MALTKQIEDARIPCTSAEQLHIELDKLVDTLALVEGENTWEKLERAVIRFAGITRGGGYKFTGVFMEGVGRQGAGIRLVQCMLSDRGRLSGAATDLLATMAPRLSIHFAPLSTLYLPPIIKLLARPNKVFLRRAEKCLLLIITHCPIPQLIPLVMDGVQDKNEQCRRACAVAVQKVMDDWDKSVIGGKVAEIEVAMRKMATDKDPEVRKAGKSVWERYKVVFPERVDSFTEPLTPTISRYLGIAAGPKGAKKPPIPTINTARPPAIGAAPRLATLTRTAQTSSVLAPTKATSSRQTTEHPPISAVRAGKMAERVPISSQSTSRPLVSRTTTLRASAISLDPLPSKPYARSKSASEIQTESSLTSLSTSRGLGGLGGPVRPKPSGHAATTMHVQTAAMRKHVSVLAGGASRPARMVSGPVNKNIAEDSSISASSSGPVRPIARLVSVPSIMSGGMAGPKNGSVTGPRDIIAIALSPTPGAQRAEARALAEVPHIARSASSTASNDSVRVKRQGASYPNKSGERIERPREPFRPGPSGHGTKDKPTARSALEGSTASLPSSEKIVAIARVIDSAQVYDPADDMKPHPETNQSPSSGEITTIANRVEANGGFFEDVTETSAPRPMPAVDDATVFFQSFTPQEDLLREMPGDGDMADGTLSAESSGAASAPMRRNIFAPPGSDKADFIPPGQPPLSAKDIPLPPSPPAKSDSTLVFPPQGLQHKPSIDRSAASSSSETVRTDWQSDAATDDDGQEDDPMVGVRFKTPSRQGQLVKVYRAQKSVDRGTAIESGRSAGSDLIQFSEGSEVSDRPLASSRRDPVSFTTVSPKIAALTQTLLSKSSNTLHSTPSTPQSNKSQTLKNRAFTPIRSGLEKVSRTGSTTPAGTPPQQRDAARALLAKKRIEGGFRHGTLARSN